MAEAKKAAAGKGGRSSAGPDAIGKRAYKKQLRTLQVELVKLQHHLIKCNEKILVIFEGRDAAGKDGAIKRIVQHLSPRETRVVALGKPSDRDSTTWYFQRYVPHLPAAQEMVLFNRSWYNRAGIEKVMGFCTAAEHAEFMHSVQDFERMLVRSGIRLFKYYLDIDKKEQQRRLAERRSDPLTQWKSSPIDAKALQYWKAYSAARNEMLARTHTETAPWTLVHAGDKRAARLNIIRDLLSRLAYDCKEGKLAHPDRAVVFPYDPAGKRATQLAK
ncbi:MAG TPA: polyphosphate kinase 2 [Rhizomicrobium sp.]|nr:polyphosphate kinase 2 [Rhizomicrobium sp.]